MATGAAVESRSLLALALAILLASLLIAEARGVSPVHVVEAVAGDAGTWSLLASISMMMAMGELYRGSGAAEELASELRAMLKSGRVVVFAVAAVFGLLPMPGGALLSAPLVDEEGKKIGMKREDIALANVWFRHIVFLVFPLTPSFLLAEAIAEVSIYKIALFQVPAFILSTVIGLAKLKGYSEPPSAHLSSRPAKLLLLLMPIASAVLLGVAGVPVPIAILAGVAILAAISHPSRRQLADAVSFALSPHVLAIAFSSLVLRRTLEDMQLKVAIPGYLYIPCASIAAAALALVAGSPLAAVGAVLPVFAEQGNLPMTSVIIVSSWTGYLCSPLHLCSILTSSYVSSSLKSLIKDIAGLAVPILIATTAQAAIALAV